MTDTVISLSQCTRRRRGGWSLEANESIRRGEIVLVTGSNGSGKTTLLRMLAGVTRFDLGARTANGTLCYLPADLVLPQSLRCQNLSALTPNFDHAQTLLGRFGFDGSLDAKFASLSFGNQRKFLYAVMLSRHDDVTIIDEFSAGIDDQGLDAMQATLVELRGGGQSFVVADQGESPALAADRRLLVHNGSVTVHGLNTETSKVKLRGPKDQLGALLEAAERLGFSRDES